MLYSKGEGKSIGITEGKSIGIAEGKIESVMRLVEKDIMSIPEACKVIGITMEEYSQHIIKIGLN